MLGLAVEPSTIRPEPDGAITIGGTVFDAPALQDITALDLGRIDARPASVLLIERPDRPRLDTLGAPDRARKHRRRAGDRRHPAMSRRPAEYTTVPRDIVREIAAWVTAAPSGPPDDPVSALADRAEITWDGGSSGAGDDVHAARARRHRRRAHGWRDARDRRVANPGSETHIGPGRAWVEYSRTLNRAGYRTIRLDCRGWGESPDGDYTPRVPRRAHGRRPAGHRGRRRGARLGAGRARRTVRGGVDGTRHGHAPSSSAE